MGRGQFEVFILLRLRPVTRVNLHSDGCSFKKKGEKKCTKTKRLLQPVRAGLALFLLPPLSCSSFRAMDDYKERRKRRRKQLLDIECGWKKSFEKRVQANSIKCTWQNGPQPRRVEVSSQIRFMSIFFSAYCIHKKCCSSSFLHWQTEVLLKAKWSPFCAAELPCFLKQPRSGSIYILIVQAPKRFGLKLVGFFSVVKVSPTACTP